MSIMLKIMFAAFNKMLSIISSLHCSLCDRMMAQNQTEWHDEKCLIWYISPIPIPQSNTNTRYARFFRVLPYNRIITLLICKFSLNLNTIQLFQQWCPVSVSYERMAIPSPSDLSGDGKSNPMMILSWEQIYTIHSRFNQFKFSKSITFNWILQLNWNIWNK